MTGDLIFSKFPSLDIYISGVLNGYICCFLAIIPCFGCVGVNRSNLRKEKIYLFLGSSLSIPLEQEKASEAIRHNQKIGE